MQKDKTRVFWRQDVGYIGGNKHRATLRELSRKTKGLKRWIATRSPGTEDNVLKYHLFCLTYHLFHRNQSYRWRSQKGNHPKNTGWKSLFWTSMKSKPNHISMISTASLSIFPHPTPRLKGPETIAREWKRECYFRYGCTHMCACTHIPTHIYTRLLILGQALA